MGRALSLVFANLTKCSKFAKQSLQQYYHSPWTRLPCSIKYFVLLKVYFFPSMKSFDTYNESNRLRKLWLKSILYQMKNELTFIIPNSRQLGLLWIFGSLWYLKYPTFSKESIKSSTDSGQPCTSTRIWCNKGMSSPSQSWYVSHSQPSPIAK